MAYRGRVIWPMGVKIAQLDATSTAERSSGNGYDPDFREPALIPSDIGGPGVLSREESLTDIIPAQVEIARWDSRLQAYTGNLPQGSLILTFHFADLERLEMIDPDTGVALIRVDDRLEGIYRLRDESLIERPQVPLFAVEPQPNSLGLSGLDRNLLLVSFTPRNAGQLAPP